MTTRMIVRAVVAVACAAAGCSGAPPATADDADPLLAFAVLQVDDDRVQCPGAAFTTIGTAVAAAAPGDRIDICRGATSRR